MCEHSHVLTRLDIDPKLLALQKRLLELFGTLDWDAQYDYKFERSRDQLRSSRRQKRAR
jgi:hypothetical protein